MKPVRITGMVIISLCWITCVMVSAGATTSTGLDRNQAMDPGQNIVAGQSSWQTPQGQSVTPDQSVGQNTAMRRGTGTDPGQDDSTTGPARSERIDRGNVTFTPQDMGANAGSETQPYRFDLGNMTASDPGPYSGNMTDNLRHTCPSGVNCTAQRFPPFAGNTTAQPPAQEPQDRNSDYPALGAESNYPVDTGPVQDNTGNGAMSPAALQSGNVSQDQIASVIQSFLTWLNAQAVR